MTVGRERHPDSPPDWLAGDFSTVYCRAAMLDAAEKGPFPNEDSIAMLRDYHADIHDEINRLKRRQAEARTIFMRHIDARVAHRNA